MIPSRTYLLPIIKINKAKMQYPVSFADQVGKQAFTNSSAVTSPAGVVTYRKKNR